MTSHRFPDVALERLVRGLRSKITLLAKIANLHRTRHSLAKYYASGSMQYAVGTWNDQLQGDVPPLFILPPPTARVKGKDKRLLDASELSRAIYDVRTAFDELLVKIAHTGGATEERRVAVMPLSSLCAIILGQHIAAGDDGDFDSVEHELAGEGLYQSIPGAYRRHAVLTHVLDLFLYECPAIPTLLMTLLEASLGAHEPYLSQHLLKALLSSAVSIPSNSKTPKICHKAHSSFLVELFVKWERSGMREEVFLDVLWDVLEISGSLAALSCTAFHLLARRLVVNHVDLFVQTLCCDLSGAFKGVLDGERHQWKLTAPRQKRKLEENTPGSMMCAQLHGWLIFLAEHLLSEPTTGLSPSCETALNRLFLLVRDKQLHMGRQLDSVHTSICSAVTCLAAVSPNTPLTVFILEAGCPSPTSFRPLLSRIITGDTQKTPVIFQDFTRSRYHVETLLARLKTYPHAHLTASCISAAILTIDDVLREYSGTLEVKAYSKQLRRRLDGVNQTIEKADLPIPRTWLSASLQDPSSRIKQHKGASLTNFPSQSVSVSVQPSRTFTTLVSGALSNRVSVRAKRRHPSTSSSGTSPSPSGKRRRISEIRYHVDSENVSDEEDTDVVNHTCAKLGQVRPNSPMKPKHTLHRRRACSTMTSEADSASSDSRRARPLKPPSTPARGRRTAQHQSYAESEYHSEDDEPICLSSDPIDFLPRRRA